MNQPVRDLMTERADRLDAPDLDVAAIMRDGSVRLRRRRARMGGVVGALVACGVVGATAVPGLLPGQQEAARTDVSFASAFADRDPAYAVGRTVHLDGRDFTVPTPVLAMVQTTAGIVYSDREGDVWSAPGDSPAEKVGTTDPEWPHLAVDGTRAAWAEETPSGAEFVLLDQDSGAATRIPAQGGATDDPQALAVDGDDLYVRDGRGLVRVDLATQEADVVSEWRGDLEVIDVEQGEIAHLAPPSHDARTVDGFVGRALGTGAKVAVGGAMVDLSDDGAYLLGETEPDTFAIFDVAAGTHELISSPDHEFLIGYRWLDRDTYLALGMNKPWDSTPVDLLRCDVGGGCTVAAPAIGSFDDGMVLPLGESMDG